MASYHRRLASQTIGLTLATIAVASTAATSNVTAAASSIQVSSHVVGDLGLTTIKANRGSLQENKMDDDEGIGPLIHHHYP